MLRWVRQRDKKRNLSLYNMRLLKKRRRILPAGDLGVSPSFKNPPRLGDIGG
jgi:hypothetical protein